MAIEVDENDNASSSILRFEEPDLSNGGLRFTASVDDSKKRLFLEEGAQGELVNIGGGCDDPEAGRVEDSSQTFLR
jgi:hypothetical protein